MPSVRMLGIAQPGALISASWKVPLAWANPRCGTRRSLFRPGNRTPDPQSARLARDPYRCLEQNTPPENRALGEMSLNNTKSGAGEQFLLPGCLAKACVKGMFFSQTRVVDRGIARGLGSGPPSPSTCRELLQGPRSRGPSLV